MKRIGNIKQYPVYRLDRTTAEKHASALARLANLIPLEDYDEGDILAKSKRGRLYRGKWEHSLVACDEEGPVAVLIAYERTAENNKLYPENSLHISILAVAENYQRQGLGRDLIKLFLERSGNHSRLNEKTVFTLQTVIADGNKHTHKLYESFGFRQTGIKKYQNRTEAILKKEMYGK